MEPLAGLRQCEAMQAAFDFHLDHLAQLRPAGSDVLRPFAHEMIVNRFAGSIAFANDITG
jgi:hypothetical protein